MFLFLFCKGSDFLLIEQIFLSLFGHLAVFRLVIWPCFIWSFGRVSFGHLAVFRLVIW